MKTKITKRAHIINPEFEVVERKGVGHPDTVSDSLAEKISVEYSKYCLENFGIVLHHNVDKVGVLGGCIDLDWGKAHLKKPIRVILDGRISRRFGSHEIPVFEIAEKAIKEQLVINLPRLDVNKDIEIIDMSTDYSKNPYWFNPRDKNDVPEYQRLFANDTSAVISYWNLSTTELLALALEGFFYKAVGVPKYSYVGQDIKVMVVRNMADYDVTLCVPFFAQDCPTEADYWNYKEIITQELDTYIKKVLPEGTTYRLSVNTQDQGKDPKATNNVRSFYLVCTGGALDYGEEGFVGRGNNRLGIISSSRPYTMEAAAGKNPVYHVGKVLGVVADEMAKELATKLKGDFEVWFVAQNGDPLFEPNAVMVNHSLDAGDDKINAIVAGVLAKRDWTNNIITQELLVPKPLIV